MTPELRDFILGFLERHRIVTLATNRADGWPQATTVSYINEGLVLYCFISRLSQKYSNIRRDGRVSLAIAAEFACPSQIQGLSMAARAEFIDHKRDFERIYALFLKRNHEFSSWGRANPALSPLVRITPEVISVLDYSKAFGHSEMVRVFKSDIMAAGNQLNAQEPLSRRAGT